MASSRSIDVIICTRNRGGLISATLDSLRANSRQDFRAFVVDQSDSADTARVVQPVCEADARFRLIATDTRGVDIARNIGSRAGNGDVVACIDDDCRADPRWLENLVAEYDRDPAAWAVFGRVVTGETRDPARQVRRWERALPMAHVDHAQRRIFERNCFDLGFGHGANMSLARTTFDRVGLFDELLGAGGRLRSWPERDLGYRILKAGGRIVYTPAALVHHDHWREWPEVKATYRNYAIGCGAAVGKYMRKGDRTAILLLLEWMWSQGLRQMVSGALRWHSWEKLYVGWMQAVYPFVGLKMGSRYRLSATRCVYLGLDEQPR
jgi:GT2 family glycosyltransferase